MSSHHVMIWNINAKVTHGGQSVSLQPLAATKHGVPAAPAGMRHICRLVCWPGLLSKVWSLTEAASGY